MTILLAIVLSLGTFPSDYKPDPCAPDKPCRSFELSALPSAGMKFLGLSVDPAWVLKNAAEVVPLLEPFCRKLGICFASRAGRAFCADVTAPEMRTVCDTRYAKGSYDHSQCAVFVEIWILGVDNHSKPPYEEAQRCVAERGGPVQRTEPPQIWMEPPSIVADDPRKITIFALDRDTRLPVNGMISFENQIFYLRETQSGRPTTFFAFKWPTKFVRVPNAEGHRDVIPPMVTVMAEGYPPAQFRLPVAVPKMIVEMTPPAAKLRPGKNKVTVSARDATTGAPVEARVMFGDAVAGDTNQPLTLLLKKGKKRPEIWVTSLFNRYSDVVVAK